MSRMLSILVLVAILVAIGTIFFRVMIGFLVPVFLAALLAVIFHPIHLRVHKRFGARSRYLAATISTLISALVVIGPAALVITLAVLEGIALVNTFGDVSVRKRLDNLRTQLQLDIPLHDDLRKIESTLEYIDGAISRGETPQLKRETLDNLVRRADRLAAYVDERSEELPRVDPKNLQQSLEQLREAPLGKLEFDDALAESQRVFRQFKLDYLGGPYHSWLKELVNPDEDQIARFRQGLLASDSPIVHFTGDTASVVLRMLIGALIMVATLFFLYADGPLIMDAVVNFLPLEEHYVRELITEFDRASRAVVLATLLSALAQGLLAGLGYQVTNVGSVFLLTLLTTVAAMVPFLGAASVWICVCLWLYFYEGRLQAAIGLAIYGTLIVSTIDNIIKPLVLHGQSNLHPLLALLSILGGVQALGPIGILVGPMSVVFLQVLVKILNREYKVFARRLQVDETAAVDDVEIPVAPPEPPPPTPPVGPPRTAEG